jgi:hypothetical protein
MKHGAANGFITFFVIFLLASMTLFFMLHRRMLSYVSSLANESAVATQQYDDVLGATHYALALVAHRFQESVACIQKTGKPIELTIDLPHGERGHLTICQRAGHLLVALAFTGDHPKKYRSSAIVRQEVNVQTAEKKILIDHLTIE